MNTGPTDLVGNRLAPPRFVDNRDQRRRQQDASAGRASGRGGHDGGTGRADPRSRRDQPRNQPQTTRPRPTRAAQAQGAGDRDPRAGGQRRQHGATSPETSANVRCWQSDVAAALHPRNPDPTSPRTSHLAFMRLVTCPKYATKHDYELAREPRRSYSKYSGMTSSLQVRISAKVRLQ